MSANQFLANNWVSEVNSIMEGDTTSAPSALSLVINFTVVGGPPGTLTSAAETFKGGGCRWYAAHLANPDIAITIHYESMKAGWDAWASGQPPAPATGPAEINTDWSGWNALSLLSSSIAFPQDSARRQMLVNATA